jgi:hypothetical protein
MSDVWVMDGRCVWLRRPFRRRLETRRDDPARGHDQDILLWSAWSTAPGGGERHAPHLEASFRAEQLNRQWLAEQAARSWLVDQAAATRPREGSPAQAVRAAWPAFVRFVAQRRSWMLPDSSKSQAARKPAWVVLREPR